MSKTGKMRVMGAIPHASGVGFRVWAPQARRVSVIGSFNGWEGTLHPMQSEEDGNWYADVAEAGVGDRYKFLPTNTMWTGCATTVPSSSAAWTTGPTTTASLARVRFPSPPTAC